jgi:hypothetical protein
MFVMGTNVIVKEGRIFNPEALHRHLPLTIVAVCPTGHFFVLQMLIGVGVGVGTTQAPTALLLSTGVGVGVRTTQAPTALLLSGVGVRAVMEPMRS